jgi:hypothetical protein
VRHGLGDAQLQLSGRHDQPRSPSRSGNPAAQGEDRATRACETGDSRADSIYGSTIAELVREEFGDGIVSRITLNGKFLPYRSW